MKRLAFLILFLGGSCYSFGQGESPSTLSMTEFTALRFDTTYFENGQINTITQQSCDGPTSNIMPHVRKVKTVYQYDQCGHWRNTTIVFEDIDPIHYGMFGPTRWQQDTPAISTSCNVPWSKPLIL